MEVIVELNLTSPLSPPRSMFLSPHYSVYLDTMILEHYKINNKQRTKHNFTLRQVDSIAKHSGCLSQHMNVQIYCMNKKIQQSYVAHVNSYLFNPFVTREHMCEGNVEE